VRERIVIERSGEVLASRLRRARTGKERRKGLLGGPRLEPGEALVIDHAFQVHTFGMDYPIDIVFCNKDWVVKHIVRSMRPGRLSRFVLSGRYAVELPSGAVADRVARGDRLLITEG
jgi:uncharacterized protein